MVAPSPGKIPEALAHGIFTNGNLRVGVSGGLARLIRRKPHSDFDEPLDVHDTIEMGRSYVQLCASSIKHFFVQLFFIQEQRSILSSSRLLPHTCKTVSIFRSDNQDDLYVIPLTLSRLPTTTRRCSAALTPGTATSSSLPVLTRSGCMTPGTRASVSCRPSR